LEDLSQALGISRRRLTRVIGDSIGIAGKTWLREIRIVRACHLLREGGKIGHLARTLGFRHTPDFSREFRKQVGLSPTSYLESEKRRMFLPEQNRRAFDGQ
jgi:AraC-like DNA-binding protein